MAESIETRFVMTAQDRASAVMASLGNQLSGLSTKFNALHATMVALPLAGALTGITASIKGAIDAGDQLNKLSQRVGISVERLGELKFAAELSGVSLDTFAKGMRGLNETLVRAQDPTSEEARLLQALGVSAKTPHEALLQVADAFAKMQDGATKSTAAQTIFKRAGQEMIPMLNLAAGGLNEAALQARRLGQVMTGETAKAAEEFNDNLTRLSKGASALGIAITSRLIKGLADYSGQLVKAKEEGSLFNGILEQGIRLAIRAAEALPGATRPLAQAAGAALDLRIAERDAELARRSAAGKVRGATAPGEDPDIERKTMCALSGGTWDPKARRCIPKATGPKQLTPDELNAQVSLNILRRQEEAAAEGEKTAEKAHQDALELEAQVSLARLKRYEEAEEAADEMVKKNREAARSFLEMADPTAAFARQLEQVRALVAEGFLAPEAGREIEFALQTQIDRINEGTAETKKFKSAAEELGLTFSSAFEDAIAGGKRFSEILHGLEQDTLRIITRKLVTEPLAGAITSKISGSGIWDFFNNILGSFFGGARAIGGPVAAGVPYLVGERGPELFLPRRSGVVIPNDDLASAGAPNINITVNVPPTLSRETASQTAARVGQAVRAALRSNG